MHTMAPSGVSCVYMDLALVSETEVPIHLFLKVGGSNDPDPCFYPNHWICVLFSTHVVNNRPKISNIRNRQKIRNRSRIIPVYNNNMVLT